jgi:hypothetical protein
MIWQCIAVSCIFTLLKDAGGCAALHAGLESGVLFQTAARIQSKKIKLSKCC